MKHLTPHRLQAAAEGRDPSPAERAHLAACADCRGELAALTGLLHSLQALPEPSRALDQAVLQRLGLAPAPRRHWRWAWGAGLTGACALLLVLARPQIPQACLRPAPCANAKAACATGSHKAATALKPASTASAPPAGAAAAPAAPAGPSTLIAAAAAASEAPPVGALAPTAVPAAPPKAMSSPKDPAARPVTALVSSVRNNLLKPGSGPLRVQLDLATPGPLSAVVYDQQGHAVADLFHGFASGQESLSWDAAGAASGPYLLIIRSQDQSQTVKLLVVR